MEQSKRLQERRRVGAERRRPGLNQQRTWPPHRANQSDDARYASSHGVQPAVEQLVSLVRSELINYLNTDRKTQQSSQMQLAAEAPSEFEATAQNEIRERRLTETRRRLERRRP